MRQGAQIAIAAGAVMATAGGLWLAWRSTRSQDLPTDGRLLCPSEAGREPPGRRVQAGDFIVVQLIDGAQTFTESTWATVLQASDDLIVAVLSGEQVAEGVRPLQSQKHGFRLGTKLLLKPECVWDVYTPTGHAGQILCGPQLEELGAFLGEDLHPVEAALTVEPGDRAQVIVGSKESNGSIWNERVWTSIVSVSPSGQVITARVQDAPQVPQNTLGIGDVVRYNRDCIVGV